MWAGWFNFIVCLLSYAFGYPVEMGELDRLLLTQTQRRTLADDRAQDGSNADAIRFYPIAGDIFVLPYSEIKTLNVSYLSLPES